MAASRTRRKDKRKSFPLEFIKDFDGTKAAIRAGYSEKSARAQACFLLKQTEVQEEIERLKGNIEATTLWTVRETVLKAIELFEEARASKSYAAAVSALKLIGKHNGAFPDRIQMEDVSENRDVNIIFEVVNG